MLDRLNASLSFYQNALDLRGQRQDVLASNIANSDTPGYKARDFDFKSALDRAVGAQGSGAGNVSLATTAPGHIGTSAHVGQSVAGEKLAYRNPSQPSLDGNTVDMDMERVAFMDNTIHYQANLQILGKQIKGLRAAMQPER